MQQFGAFKFEVGGT